MIRVASEIPTTPTVVLFTSMATEPVSVRQVSPTTGNAAWLHCVTTFNELTIVVSLMVILS